jgi:glycosyltransferase involved in cell wall biosynthesis
MRIAFDARHVGRGLGIATFATSLATALIETGEVELTWLGDPGLAPAGVRRSVRVDRLPYPVLDGLPGRALVARLGVELIHFTGNTGWARPGPVPSVLTLHDLMFLRTDLRVRRWRQKLGHRYERWLIERCARAAGSVAVPTETVAAEVAAWSAGEVRPLVILEGVEAPPPDVGPPPHSGAYLLAFAARDPRKRTADVVAAWRAVGDPGLKLRLLARAGLPAGLATQLEPDVAAGRVELLSDLPRPALWGQLAGAVALAFPSDDEGFGLPVLEAMSVGTPVLAGVAAATREVGGDAIAILDPGDIPGSLAAAVRRIRDDGAYADGLVARGRARAAEFTWPAAARHYLELYRSTIASGRRRP